MKILVKTDFRNNTVKRAFLFCCFCGIRHCDVAALTWGDLKEDNEGKYTLNMVQQKTKIAISIPLSGEAIKQLPPKGNAKPTDKVFADLISLGRTNEILPKWAESAGIDKHLTFHVARAYPCNHDDHTWSRFIYCIKITWAYKYSSYANIC